MNNLIRILLVLIYPIILLGAFFLIYRKYKNTIKGNLKPLIINTVLGFLVISIGLIVFYHFEDTIYAYDYAGHWLRALTLRQHFFNNPKDILSLVYYSMNNYDYSYLPALFGLPFIIINTSYVFFSISNLLIFLLPTYLLLQILYFKYINKSKYLPLIIFLVFYPLYLTLFFGKVDCSGLFFITLAYSLIILPNFEEIDLLDNLSINIFVVLAVFLRRWYLYSIICLYLAYFIKFLFNRNLNNFKKLVSSGIFALVIMLLFFRTFITNSLTNNFEEIYAFYNHEGKFISFINNISPIIFLVSIIGAFKLFKNDLSLFIINIVSIVLPCALIWRIQSFEYHHYYIFILNILILFVYGLISLKDLNKYIPKVILVLLVIQIPLIFSYVGNTMPIFTNIRKNPEVLKDKKEIVELAYYLRSIETDDETSAFLSAGTYGIITDDLIRNALLPDIDAPHIDSAVFDIRDGFPKDFEYIRYIITVDPIVYADENFQHMFTIISDAITKDPEISSIYNPIHTTRLLDKYTVTVYEKTGVLTKEMKKHFYDEMLKYYPDKAEYFSYILD